MSKSDQPGNMARDIVSLVREGTKKWTKIQKTEERNPAARRHRRQRMTMARGISLKDAAAKILPEAYDKVSGGGMLPANARQLMYAARPYIQKITGQELKSNYFTQTLLPDYMMETGVAWDVVFDARGHFVEPFGGKMFGIGTLEVRGYLKGMRDPSIEEAKVKAKVETWGPAGNFGAVLFIEKEGFSELLKAAKIADRFDISIMSTKGMSVVAARALADEMCHDQDIPLLLMHDFDKSGFSIAGTLQRDTRRYEFQNLIQTIDLGLNLEDVTVLGLEPEYQHHPKGTKEALIENLRENGATEAEIAFMFQEFDRLRSTRRVELNAMTSPQMIALIEKKLRAHGVKKIVPDKALLAEVYTEFENRRRLQEIVDRLDGTHMEGFKVPADLEGSVRQYLKDHPDARWDTALSEIVTNGGGPPPGKKSPPSGHKSSRKPSDKTEMPTASGADVLNAVRNVLGKDYRTIGSEEDE
jgi:hypothetical protein